MNVSDIDHRIKLLELMRDILLEIVMSKGELDDGLQRICDENDDLHRRILG